jgi:hypothetical protein
LRPIFVRSRVPCHDRKHDFEFRARSGHGIDQHGRPEARGDPVNHGQSQSGALAGVSGSREIEENAGEPLRAHTSVIPW